MVQNKFPVHIDVTIRSKSVQFDHCMTCTLMRDDECPFSMVDVSLRLSASWLRIIVGGLTDDVADDGDSVGGTDCIVMSRALLFSTLTIDTSSVALEVVVVVVVILLVADVMLTSKRPRARSSHMRHNMQNTHARATLIRISR